MEKEKFYHLALNLQQGIITTLENVSNNIVAIYSLHNDVIVIRPEYRGQLKQITDEVYKNRDKEKNSMYILFGDAFHIDTWDNLIENFKK